MNGELGQLRPNQWTQTYTHQFHGQSTGSASSLLILGGEWHYVLDVLPDSNERKQLLDLKLSVILLDMETRLFKADRLTDYVSPTVLLPSVLWGCWMGGRKGIRPVKTESWGTAWLSVWNEVQMICIWFCWCHCHPIISCSSKIQIGLTFLVPAYPGCPGKKAIKRMRGGVKSNKGNWLRTT